MKIEGPEIGLGDSNGQFHGGLGQNIQVVMLGFTCMHGWKHPVNKVRRLLCLSAFLLPMLLGFVNPPFITSSLHPGYTPETVRTDKSLVGVWADPYLGEIAIAPLADGSYHVRSNGGGLLALLGLTFKARLFQLQNALFVDLVPSGAALKNIYPADSHVFAVIRIEGRTLALTLLNPEFVAAQVRAYPRKLKYVEYRNGLLLTEPPAVLQRVLMEIAVKPGSAYETYVFTRR
jgi:hypothetical protein